MLCVVVGPILSRLLSRMNDPCVPGLRVAVPGELLPSRVQGAGLAVLLTHLQGCLGYQLVCNREESSKQGWLQAVFLLSAEVSSSLHGEIRGFWLLSAVEQGLSAFV